jgi:hypothetical protein
MADSTVAEMFGGFLQFFTEDSRLTTSQVAIGILSLIRPPHMSSLEKPLQQKIIYESKQVLIEYLHQAMF